jgi:hypothetical protein
LAAAAAVTTLQGQVLDAPQQLLALAAAGPEAEITLPQQYRAATAVQA